ncbi:MAG TPA: SDR family oxidoreductase [Ramlibacter sp.]|nr:SDR family oxidoreductase [Ramlibacter sp.]
MTGRLNGKVALVFGAGCTDEGLSNGAAVAVAYAREGAKVVAIDVNLAAARRTAELIRRDGGQALEVVADVTSSTEVHAAVQSGLDAFGKLDILHNNVGINSPGGPVEMDEDTWDKVILTNTKSLFLTCKAVIPVFIRNGGGAIVNISSIAGVTYYGRPAIAYSASKAAVNQFTRSIAAQYGPDNIRCNAIVAGLIDTPRSASQLRARWEGDEVSMRRQRAESVPLKRLGTPAELANTSVFLASDEASYVTGVVMAVDGGLTCAVPHSTPNPSNSN